MLMDEDVPSLNFTGRHEWEMRHERKTQGGGWDLAQ